MTRFLATMVLGCLSIVALAAANPTRAQTPQTVASVTGDWRVADGSAVIRFAPCEGGALCGRIVQLRDDPLARDAANPIRSLRSRSVCGLTILSSLRSDTDGRWIGGRLYDPESGYALDEISLQRRGEGLRVTIGSGPFAGSETWRRISPSVTPCVAG